MGLWGGWEIERFGRRVCLCGSREMKCCARCVVAGRPGRGTFLAEVVFLGKPGKTLLSL